MRFLVDTHAFLWAVRSPEELTARVRNIFLDSSAELLISIVVPWEMAIKSGIGKLNTENILDDFDRLVTAGGYSLLETSTRHVIQSGALTPHHRDPFDRLLIAQSLDLRIPILSCDEILDRYGVRRVWS